MAGNGSDDGGGESETVAGGNTAEEAEAGWLKLNKNDRKNSRDTLRQKLNLIDI